MRLRPHSKDESKALNPEPKPEKVPYVVTYDKDDVRIGDDGYSMTPARSRLHHMLNAIFVWGIVCAVLGAGCAIIAYAQGQTYGGNAADFSSFNLEVYGGNMFNGFEVATLLRIEAIILLFSALFGPVISIQGFHWFYDGKPVTFTAVVMAVVSVFVVIYQVMLVSIVGIVDPFSLVTLIMVILIALFMRSVAKERPTLRKAKVARSEIKNAPKNKDGRGTASATGEDEAPKNSPHRNQKNKKKNKKK